MENRTSGEKPLAWISSAPVRLLAYYVLAFLVIKVVIFLVPGLEQAVEIERARHILSLTEGLDSVSGPHGTMIANYDVAEGSISAVVALSLSVALTLSFPVSWVYGWTTKRKLYSQSFSQSLVVLPLVIATVVFIVKGSLALAFSLAGIVAAVRFRHRLSETRDAIFVFMAIGIGLAVGVQLMNPAIVASAAFNLTVVMLHSRDYGSKPSKLDGLTLFERQRKNGAPAGPSETPEPVPPPQPSAPPSTQDGA